MKDISNRRRYKLFLKDIQRNRNEGFKKIKLFFAEKGVLLDYYNIHDIFNKLSVEQFKRFMKICRRVGNAAKKRDAYIKALDVYYLVKRNETSDAREIPFFKIEKVSQKIMNHSYMSYREDGTEYLKGLDSYRIGFEQETLSEVSNDVSLMEMVKSGKI